MNKYLADAATFPADARLAWRNDGAAGVWLEIAERTLYRVARAARYDLYERDLSGVKYVAAPAGVEVRMLEREEHAMLDALMTSRRRVQLARHPTTRTVFAALRHGTIIGYSWWSRVFESVLDFSPLSLPDDAIFHGFVHVARAERHGGIAGALFSAGETYLRDHGARLCWLLVNSANATGARVARTRTIGPMRHVAHLGYTRFPFRTTRTLIVSEAS